MLIWIPVDGSGDEKQSKIAKLFELEQWALIDFDAGEVKSTRFFKNREEFGDWVDFVVLANRYESYMDFMNEGMMVLCVRKEESIEEIMEAYKFKELDEMGL